MTRPGNAAPTDQSRRPCQQLTRTSPQGSGARAGWSDPAETRGVEQARKGAGGGERRHRRAADRRPGHPPSPVHCAAPLPCKKAGRSVQKSGEQVPEERRKCPSTWPLQHTTRPPEAPLSTPRDGERRGAGSASVSPSSPVAFAPKVGPVPTHGRASTGAARPGHTRDTQATCRPPPTPPRNPKRCRLEREKAPRFPPATRQPTPASVPPFSGREAAHC